MRESQDDCEAMYLYFEASLECVCFARLCVWDCVELVLVALAAFQCGLPAWKHYWLMLAAGLAFRFVFAVYRFVALAHAPWMHFCIDVVFPFGLTALASLLCTWTYVSISNCITF
ncbi:unnamed protein product [Lathyrus oleraceus]